MTTTTAHVEVLTAEVRVLMVGSRQVTLSVYSQLDIVRPDEIEPFGRVRPRDAEKDLVYAVGASARDRDLGSLVRSQRKRARPLRDAAEHYRDRAQLITKYRAVPDQGVLDQLGRLMQPTGWTWWTSGEKQAWAKRLEQDIDTREYFDRAAQTERAAAGAEQWEALPLIVLAGLR
jgi:hypothetical protein